MVMVAGVSADVVGLFFGDLADVGDRLGDVAEVIEFCHLCKSPIF